jgi:hypothetical protein
MLENMNHKDVIYFIGMDKFIFTFKGKQNLLKQQCVHFSVGSVGVEIYLEEFSICSKILQFIV